MSEDHLLNAKAPHLRDDEVGMALRTMADVNAQHLLSVLILHQEWMIRDLTQRLGSREDADEAV